ncbi:MAG: CAP domain-containing protein [Paracoccaceae bacterium]
MSARVLKPALLLFIIAVLSNLPSQSAAQSCARSSLPTSAASIVPTNNPDQTLFNRAVLSEVNFERCRAGLSPLRSSNGLITVAGNHAKWMAKRGALSHQSTVRGQSTVQQRVLASGLNARRGSENIGNLPRFQFGGSRRIQVNSMSRCEFSTVTGRKIAPHSYASLANQIVDMWMRSKDHRKNVLDRNVNSVGAALGFDTKGSYCGQFFLSQNFAG